MNFDDVKGLEAINKYADQCEEAKSKLEEYLLEDEAVQDEEGNAIEAKAKDLGLSSIDQVFKISSDKSFRVSNLLSEDQKEKVASTVLEFLAQNEAESKQYISEVKLPEKTTLVQNILKNIK